MSELKPANPFSAAKTQFVPPKANTYTTSACLTTTRRRRRKRGSQSVPYVLIEIALAGLTLCWPLAECLINDNSNQVVKQAPPVRKVPADTIVLANGSTAHISSLEDYLSQLERPENSSRADEAANAPRSGALLQLEREESVRKPSRAKAQEADDQAHHQHHHQLHHHQETGLIQKKNSTSKPILQHWQVKHLLNVTADYPLAYSQIIWGYVWPLMAGLTLFTNLMIVFVLTQHDMRTPTNVVLTSIAIADIFPILVPVPWFVYLFAMGNEKQVLYPPLACYFYQHSTRSVSELFYFLSTWLNVLLAIHDYLSACMPKAAKRFCQIRVVVLEIVSLTLLAFLLNLPQLLKIVYKPVKFYYNDKLTWGCKATQASWFKDFVGDALLYDDIFAGIIVILVDGGPSIVLITITALLIRQLQRQRIRGHLLMERARTASKRRRERHRQQEYESSARVMIFVLIAFLTVKLPFAAIYSLMIIQSRFQIHFVENLADFQKALSVVDLIIVLTYPLNFTIFCCCSKKFRHKCIQLLGECDRNTRSAKIRLLRGLSDSFKSSQSRNSYKTDSNASSHSQTTNSIESSRAKVSLISDNFEKSLDFVCDGRNHFDCNSIRDLRQTSFRASLSNGSVCLECMMRHKEVKMQQQSEEMQWRLSSDSALLEWPIPPPPPPIQISQYNLPHIVTIDCEEQQAVDDSSVNGQQRDIEADRKSSCTESWISEDSVSCQQNRSLGGESAGMEPKSRQDNNKLSEPKKRSVSSSARGSSDPGSANSLLRQLTKLVRNSDVGLNQDGRQDGRQEEGQKGTRSLQGGRESRLKQIESKQRSMSVSNSKLSALPNATGLLADILKATLFEPLDSHTGKAHHHRHKCSHGQRESRAKERK